MGTAPPPDGPPPAAAAIISEKASFQLTPPVKLLCGFSLPALDFAFGFNLSLPIFHFPPPLPTFSLSIGLNCSLKNPISVSGGLSWGGGRVSNSDPNPDDLVARQTR